MSERSGQATQLEFNQAMTDFKIMFPNMDVDVIEAVLRSNNGAVDTTIDQLLAMTADIETPKPSEDEVTPPPAYQNNLPSYHQAVKNEPTDDLMGASSIGQPDLLSGLDSYGASGGGDVSDIPLCVTKGWKPPLLGKLPSNFLRIRSLRQGHSYNHPDRPENPSCSSSLSQEMIRERMSENQKRLGSISLHEGPDHQMLEDEKFALMLQNKEFMSELRGNHEFLSTLEEDLPSNEEPVEIGSKKGTLGMDDALFKEKLKNMGKQSKQKFTKLANMFTRQGGATRLLGHAPAPSKDNLLLNAEPLVDPHESDSEEEDTHRTTKGRKYQLM